MFKTADTNMWSEYLIWKKQNMAKSLFEQLGGTYHKENGYFIQDLRLPAEEEQPIGIWGQRHLDYLKQYRTVTAHAPRRSLRLQTVLFSVHRWSLRG